MAIARHITLGRVALAVTLVLVCTSWFASGGAMFSPGALSEEQRGGRQLGGVSSHAEIGACSACHAPPWSGQTMAERCLECHTEVREQIETRAAMHGKMPDAMACRACHAEHRGTHASLTDLGQFEHDWTVFPLTGKHRNAACSSCHRADTPHRAAPQSCAACHVKADVHKGRFGTNCSACHGTETWSGAVLRPEVAKFDHDATGFKLTGQHRTLDCKACHTAGVFKGTSSTCVACHAEPVVHKDRFGSNCVSCHTTATWKGAVFKAEAAKFDHNLTAFKLTGKHRTVDCKSCHKSGAFTGTPQTCVSCHTEPPTPAVHKSRYGTNCAECHTSASFTGAVFKHPAFPISHGSRRSPNTCATCHNAPGNFKAYTCYNCHEHERARMVRVHRGRKVANLEQCVLCHKGRRGERRERVGFLDFLEMDGDHACGRCPDQVGCTEKPPDVFASEPMWEWPGLAPAPLVRGLPPHPVPPPTAPQSLIQPAAPLPPWRRMEGLFQTVLRFDASAAPFFALADRSP